MADRGHEHTHGLHGHKRLNKEVYDSRPGERRRFEVEPSKIVSTERLIPWIAQRLPDGARVLDVAGGAGWQASKLLRSSTASVIGADISESAVRERREDPLLRSVVADMEALPFAAEEFDAVMFVACLHHAPQPRPALAEAWRVLRPGGLLFASEPSSLRARRSGVIATEDGHEFAISSRWLAENLRQAGFAIEEIRHRRLAARILTRLIRRPSVAGMRRAERADDLLLKIPGLQGLGSLVLMRARKA